MQSTVIPSKFEKIRKLIHQLRVSCRARLNAAANKEMNEGLSNERLADNQSPYVQARQEWNLMFGDLIKAKHNWQRIAILSLCATLLLIINNIRLDSRSQYVPYAVKVDQLGNSNFAGYLTASNAISSLEMNAFVRRYITNVRSIIADPVAEKKALNFVYTTSTEKTAKILNDNFRKNDPFKLAQTTTVEVQINSAMPKSDKTWQVGWTEIQRDLDGRELGQTHWEALVTVGQHPVSDARIININPLGLFVENITWSQQL